MNCIKYCTFYLIFCCSHVTYSADWANVPRGEWQKVLQNISKPFLENSYQVTFSACTFKDYTTKAIEDEQRGDILKSGKKFKSQSMGMNSFQNDSLQWIVAGSEKVIMLSKPSNMLDKTILQPWDEKYYSLIKEVQEKMTENSYQIKVIYNNQCAYHSYEVWMDLNKKKVLKCNLYFNGAVKHNPLDENSIKTKPRVEITFDKWSFTPIVNKEDFNTLNYFTRNKKGELVPTSNFANYRIVDTRLNVSKQ